MYSVDVLLPTARFAFAVDGARVEVAPEHRSPEGYIVYEKLAAARAVVGMTTFPNTVLLRGPRTLLIDPGLHLQNEPVLRALEARGLAPRDLDLVLLTHAHLDHAGACADVGRPVAVHTREREAEHWPAVAGMLVDGRLTLLEGDEGEVAPGVTWALTPGHTAGGVSYRVVTTAGLAVICGDTIGPLRRDFDQMAPPPEEGDVDELLSTWRLIRSWQPALIVPGHLPPFKP
jgi:glyoxylase-like metal-dependent hydrolase (beta-lactamase superfamily II)